MVISWYKNVLSSTSKVQHCSLFEKLLFWDSLSTVSPYIKKKEDTYFQSTQSKHPHSKKQERIRKEILDQIDIKTQQRKYHFLHFVFSIWELWWLYLYPIGLRYPPLSSSASHNTERLSRFRSTLWVKLSLVNTQWSWHLQHPWISITTTFTALHNGSLEPRLAIRTNHHT